MQLLTLTHALHFVSVLGEDDGAPHSEGTSAPLWTAALKSSATNVRRGCARAFMYDGLWETDVENLRTFVGSIVNDARKAKNHRYRETHPRSLL